MPLVRRPSPELVLPVDIWSAAAGEPDGADESLGPHRIDVVDTRERRLLDPILLGTKYFITSRSPDEERFRWIILQLEEAHRVAIGTMLLGAQAVSVMLNPAGATFELCPILSRRKNADSLPLGTIRIATIHIGAAAMSKLRGSLPPVGPLGDLGDPLEELLRTKRTADDS